MNGDDPQPTSLRRAQYVGISGTQLNIRLAARRQAYHNHRARNKSLLYIL